MRDLALIENDNNLEVTNFDLVLTGGSLYVANKIRIRLKTFKNEWYLNINAGLPYYESILIKNPNLDYVADLYITEILGTEGVKEIDEFNLEVEGRDLKIAFIAILDNGDSVEIEETV